MTSKTRMLGRHLRHYPKLFAIRTFRTRFALGVVAFLGTTATVAQIAFWVLGASGTGVYAAILVAVVLLGTAVILIRMRPPFLVDMAHPTASARIAMRIADLFDPAEPAGSAPPAVVVTVNRHFDTSLPWVASASLVTQLAHRWYPETGQPGLRAEILQALGIQQEQEQPLGAVVTVSPVGHTVLLLAVASRHEDTRSSVLVDEVWTGLAQLWRHVRRHNLTAVRIPVVGSGFARAQVGQIPLLVLLLTSYVTASMEQPVCPIEIVLPGDSAGADTFELVRTYCESLGFRDRKTGAS